MKKERYGIIYLIRNEINGKIYIGQTIRTFDERYVHDVEKHTHNEHLRRSIQKYGIENFYIDKEFDVAYSKEELDKLESMYIKIYNTTNPDYGYNKQTGGSSGKHNEETKEKIRQANIGANNHSAKKVICLNTGEIFECIMDASRKYNCDNGHISQSCKNPYIACGELEDGTRLKWMFFKDYLNATKEEIEDKLDYIKYSKGSSVVCITTGEIFKSAIDASNKYNANHTDLCGCCRNKKGSCGQLEDETPLKWLFYEDYLNMTKEEIEDYKNDFSECCIRRKIICLNDKKIFNNSREASDYYNCDNSCICKICKGKKKSIKGYYFMYYQDYLKLPLEEQSKEYKNNYKPQNKIIICLEDNKIFKSMSEASRYYNITSGDISRVCNKLIDSIKGLHFMLYDEYLRKEKDNA